MKTKLISKVMVTLLLSGLLFTMPVSAFLMNSGNVISVFASDGEEAEEVTEIPTEVEKANCICKDKCSQYAKNKDCPACSVNYTDCEYIIPNVKLTITTPPGWYSNSTKVMLAVKDTKKTGNFEVQMVEAKISQNGSWTDVTEDMYIEISENCTIYMRVTDQLGKTYEKNRYIKCFDFTKPTLNAAVSNGLLSVQAHDTDSGIAKVYVNGYEFKKLNNGVLNVRLQQFDAGYQYFTIQAMDNAGNMSEVYKTTNPYYTDPETKDSNSTSNPAEQLQVNAQASAPSSATATVTEHTKTDSSGKTISESSIGSNTSDATKTVPGNDTEKGKEFYTIQTESEKTFYLIVDRDSEEEKVYFLTEIDENDLLNTTTNTDETLPKNSAALESAIPVSDEALSNNNVENVDTATEKEEITTVPAEEVETAEEIEPVKKDNDMFTWILLGGVGLLVILGTYYIKVVRKKDGDFLDEDDDEDDEEVYENEDEDLKSDDFFDNKDDNEDEQGKEE